jgi:hypothetical protein
MFSHAFSDAVFDGFGHRRGSKRMPNGGPKSFQNLSKIEVGAETRFGLVLDPIWDRFSSNSEQFWVVFGHQNGRISKGRTVAQQQESGCKTAPE